MKRLSVAAAAVLACLALAGPAQAADRYVLDETMSLTGDTSTSVVDPSPDPGGDHPPKRFDNPCGAAVDSNGYVYVTSRGFPGKEEGRVDIFDPEGEFVTEIVVEAGLRESCGAAVDSEGNVYTVDSSPSPIVLHKPDSYPPTETTSYGTPQAVGGKITRYAVAVDPASDYVYASGPGNTSLEEFDSAKNGSALLRSIPLDSEGAACAADIDVWGQSHDIYLSGCPFEGGPKNLIARAFVLDGASGEVKQTLTGAATPDGSFSFLAGYAGVAVDQDTGELHLSDFPAARYVARFAPPGPVGPGEEAPEQYLGCVGNDKACNPLFKSLVQPQVIADVAVDNSGGPNNGYLYVTSGDQSFNSHLWAFKPCPPLGPPSLSGESVTAVGTTSATLKGTVNPGCLDATYRFQYTSEADFEENGWANAISTPEGELSSSAPPTPVSASISGLKAGTAYRFRLLGASHCIELEPEALCEGEGDASPFATYPIPSSGLPDNRAYELVTPPDTGGRTPTAAVYGWQTFSNFPISLSTAEGNSLLFGVEGGSLPETPGSGVYDAYEAKRSESGWQTSFIGPTGNQMTSPRPGGVSATHDYSFVLAERVDEGTLGPPESSYLRSPDGSFELIGLGSLGEDRKASGKWISPGGEDIVFTTGEGPSMIAVQLEPDAPPSGTDAIYRRDADGPTEVVSLLPGEVPLATGEDAVYQGTSANAQAIAFKVKGTLYLRLGGAQTLQVATGNPVFGGLSGDGSRLFYLAPNLGEPVLEGGIQRGEIFAFDVAGETTTPIGSGTKAVLVNVSDDGSHAYFTSTEQIGGEGVPGAENLYLWDGTEVGFIATLEQGDVIGEFQVGYRAHGVGLWSTDAVSGAQSKYQGPANASSRTTPDGTVLVFESRAELSAFENDGRRQIYRYEAGSDELLCLSCNPTGAAAAGDAQLQSPTPSFLAPFPPANALSDIANLTSDGESVFFESPDPLVLRDIDGELDVYQWRAEGSGACKEEGGCHYLISSGKSTGDDYLYAMTPDGSDVFFQSGDLLVAEDKDGTPSIYDARVGGGIPEPAPIPAECLGEACQPAVVAPEDPSPATAGAAKPGNPPAPSKRRCPKGKRKAAGKGAKTRCVKRQRSQKQNRGRKR